MRVFIATWLPDGLRDRIGGFVRDIRNRAEIQAPVRWVPPEAMHLTLQFLGEVPRPIVDRIETELGRIQAAAFRVRVRGVGFFPRETAPRVFWAGITSEGFPELADRVQRRMARLGFQPPDRPLTPHLTLARARGRRRLDQALVEAARGFREYEFGSAMLDRMVMVESRLSPDGARYSQIAEFKFEGPG